jgi:ADP-ribose pyrophosphatase YjhB (NUDIX family)
MYRPNNSSVAAIIWNASKDKIVLVKRKDVPIWVLPGGGVDPGEDFDDAILREVREETGLNVSIEEVACIYLPTNRLTRYTKLFSCLAEEESLRSCPNETAAIGFFSLDELPATFFFIHQRWLNDALSTSERPYVAYLNYVTYGQLLLFFLKHPLWVLRFAWTKARS